MERDRLREECYSAWQNHVVDSVEGMNTTWLIVGGDSEIPRLLYSMRLGCVIGL